MRNVLRTWPGFTDDLFRDVLHAFRSMQRDLDEMVRWTASNPPRPDRQLDSGQQDRELPFWRGFPAIDAWVENDELHLRAALPGIRPEGVEVSVQEGMLVVRGHRVREPETGERRYLVREMDEGWFERRFRLPESLDADQIEARFHDGLLHIRVPAVEGLMPRKVPIQINGAEREQGQISASS
jgi:HSP20 family protein